MLKCNDLSEWIKKTIGCNMGRATTMPRGVQIMSVFAYNCNTKTTTIVQRIAGEIEAFLENFCTETKGGSGALLAVQQLCIPAIFMHDREEHISVTIERESPDSLSGRVRISTLKTGGPNGISPFLGSLTEIFDNGSRIYPDHCSSYLQEVVDEVILDVPVMLSSFLSSSELIRYFPEAKPILRKNKAYGARFSTFEEPKKHGSLKSFVNTACFSWCFPKQSGAPYA
jgi:hypothetical protein